MAFAYNSLDLTDRASDPAALGCYLSFLFVWTGGSAGVTGDLRQIVYISRATAGCGDEEVWRINQVAKSRNQDCGVTGLLLFDGKRFIQAIEGSSDAIQSTMDRIVADKRHSHLQIATDRPVDRRQFGSWSMQARKTPTGGCSASFLRKVKELMQDVDDAALQALFIGFTILGGPARA